jgi:radical SAM enzyme (TIGR01210 family)
VLLEEERGSGGALESVLTVFLAGSECPFTCVFCDLWRHTLEGPTPRGALPAQLERALAAEEVRRVQPRRVKLYNASNFFDPRAVPPEDLPALAKLLEGFEGVTVECHPRLVGDGCIAFADRLTGRLEVAMGLETVHPKALARLNKEMSLDEFDVAVGRLERARIDVRAFVLVGTPFIEPREQAVWAARSASYALDRGVRVAALIPVRGGNGELERLAAAGDFTAPRLPDLEEALDAAHAAGPGIVLADLWDVGQLPACAACQDPRVERLRALNRAGPPQPPVECTTCGWAGVAR